jgi:hypothetical protein
MRINEYHGRILPDPRHWEYDILAFQEPYLNRFGPEIQTHNPIKDGFRAYIANHSRARVAVFINRTISAGNIDLTDFGPNLLAVASDLCTVIVSIKPLSTTCTIRTQNPSLTDPVMCWIWMDGLLDGWSWLMRLDGGGWMVTWMDWIWVFASSTPSTSIHRK